MWHHATSSITRACAAAAGTRARGAATLLTLRTFATRAELTAARAAAASPTAFAARTRAALAAVRAGLDGMLEANPGMRVDLRDADGDAGVGASLTIVVPPGGAAGGGSGTLGEKTLKLWVDTARPDGAPALIYDSPKHPQRAYRPSPTGTWRDINDGHLLAELLARDLIYFAKGYPAFNIDVATGDGGIGAAASVGGKSWPLR